MLGFIGLIVGLIGAAIGVIMGVMGAIFGVVFGLAVPLSPFLIFAVVIWLLVRGPSRPSVPAGQPTIRR